MDEYISRIRTQQPKSEAKPRKKVQVTPHEKVPEISEEEIYIEYEQPGGFTGWLSSIFRSQPKSIPQEEVQEDLTPEEMEKLEHMEDEIEEIDEDIEELEEKREGLVARFLQSMRLFRHKSPPLTDDEILEDVVPVIDEDVKETLKTLHKWLEKLPNNELRAFRVSDDFQSYKAILEKYGLIKEK